MYCKSNALLLAESLFLLPTGELLGNYFLNNFGILIYQYFKVIF